MYFLRYNFLPSIVLGLSFMTGAVASASHARLEQVSEDLVTVARQACDIPEKIHPLSYGYLKRFVKQVLPGVNDPVLATAFLKGFSLPNSTYEAYGVCVVVFLNQPQNVVYEPYLDAVGLAEKYNAFPRQVFVGLDASGHPVFHAL